MEAIRMVMECVELKDEIMKKRTAIYKNKRRERTIEIFDEFFGENHTNNMNNDNTLKRDIQENTPSSFWSIILDRNIGNWTQSDTNTSYEDEVSDFGINMLRIVHKQYIRWIKMTFKNKVCDDRENFIYGNLSERTYTEDEQGFLTRTTTINPASMCIGIFGECDEDEYDNFFLRIEYEKGWRRFYQEREDLQDDEVIDIWDLDDDWDDNPSMVMSYGFNEILKHIGKSMTTLDDCLWEDQEENWTNPLRDDIFEWLDFCDENMTKLDFKTINSDVGIQVFLSLLSFIGMKNNLIGGEGQMGIIEHNLYIDNDYEVMNKVFGGGPGWGFMPMSVENHRGILKEEEQ